MLSCFESRQEFQAKNWTEYSTAISRYLKALYKVREKQAEVSENVAEARVQQAELEKSLGTSLANLESKFRQIVGGSRSAIASVQDDLEISLGRIASQYSEGSEDTPQSLSDCVQSGLLDQRFQAYRFETIPA